MTGSGDPGPGGATGVLRSEHRLGCPKPEIVPRPGADRGITIPSWTWIRRPGVQLLTPFRSFRPSAGRLAVALAVTGAFALSACGGDDTSSATSTPERAGDPPTAATVSIEQSRFLPDELTVDAGTTVEFVNEDPFAHTVTSKEGGPVQFDSGDLGQDEAFEQTFDEPGTYDYFCEIHPTMRASVVVDPVS